MRKARGPRGRAITRHVNWAKQKIEKNPKNANRSPLSRPQNQGNQQRQMQLLSQPRETVLGTAKNWRHATELRDDPTVAGRGRILSLAKWDDPSCENNFRGQSYGGGMFCLGILLYMPDANGQWVIRGSHESISSFKAFSFSSGRHATWARESNSMPRTGSTGVGPMHLPAWKGKPKRSQTNSAVLRFCAHWGESGGTL